MDEQTITGYIRGKVVCVFRNGTRILVGDGFDTTKQELFFCPLGGGIEFGERSEAALRREIREELGVEIDHLRLLGVLENLYTFDGEKGHEIVFVYDAQLRDRSMYQVPRFQARETNGQTFNAFWIDLDSIGPDTPPIYPDGLIDLLARPTGF